MVLKIIVINLNKIFKKVEYFDVVLIFFFSFVILLVLFKKTKQYDEFIVP